MLEGELVYTKSLQCFWGSEDICFRIATSAFAPNTTHEQGHISWIIWDLCVQVLNVSDLFMKKGPFHQLKL
jgi:hypothetical protein